MLLGYRGALMGFFGALLLALTTTFAGLWIGEPDYTEADLRKAVRLSNIRPLEVREFEADPKFVLGRALFFDPILSGPRNVSCSTCHLLSHGTSDGLPRAIGVDRDGRGPHRTSRSHDGKMLRHTLPLWNRDHNAVTSLFWDGRVEVLDPVRRIFRSPLGDRLPIGLENALAVQALFPLVDPQEMLGDPADVSSANLPPEHRMQPNELPPRDRLLPEDTRIIEALNNVVGRVVGYENPNSWQKTYRGLFLEAYPTKKAISITEIANALSHYQELAFATRDTKWDRYLRGDNAALSNQAKSGALLFYGKARCVACHSGALFSDFSFHSIGVFDGKSKQDLGRGGVTRNDADDYKFRTPSLHNIRMSGPYFHNGSASDLKQAIRIHFQAMDNADKYNLDGSFMMSRKQIESISSFVTVPLRLTETELNSLVAFLDALTYSPANLQDIVPQSVPSGLRVVFD